MHPLRPFAMSAPRLRLLSASLVLAGNVFAAPDAPWFPENLLFEEAFTNTTGANRNIDVRDYEWASFTGEDGKLNRAGTSISHAPGQPAEPPGFLTVSSAAGQSRVLVRNLKGGLDLAGTVVRFRFGANHGRAGARLILRVGGSWYVSETVFSSATNLPNGAAFAAAPKDAVLRSLVFTRDASAWRAFTLSPGVAAEITSPARPAALPSSVATAIGFVFFNDHASWGASGFFDTLEVIRLP